MFWNFVCSETSWMCCGDPKQVVLCKLYFNPNAMGVVLCSIKQKHVIKLLELIWLFKWACYCGWMIEWIFGAVVLFSGRRRRFNLLFVFDKVCFAVRNGLLDTTIIDFCFHLIFKLLWLAFCKSWPSIAKYSPIEISGKYFEKHIFWETCLLQKLNELNLWDVIKIKRTCQCVWGVSYNENRVMLWVELRMKTAI